MKKLLLIISLLIPMIYSGTNVESTSNENRVSNECLLNGGLVRITDENSAYIGNGFIYKVDERYAYIVSSTKNDFSEKNAVLYANGEHGELIVLGKDKNNDVIVFRTSRINGVKSACIGNSEFLDKGERVAFFGYSSIDTKEEINTIITNVGVLYSKENYVRIYKDTVQINNENDLYNGGIIFNSSGYLVGMLDGSDSRIVNKSYMINSLKLTKIADSIVKDGKYEPNYIKYTIEDYGSLSVDLRKNYDVSDKVDTGVVITTFKVFNYIFGKLNQGMVIVEVNGVEIKNTYELDIQLNRYKKKDKVCFKVIKKNGKEAYYYINV